VKQNHLPLYLFIYPPFIKTTQTSISLFTLLEAWTKKKKKQQQQ